MGTISRNTFEINGVIDTNQTVLNNLNMLCTASGCWMTFDINTGKWSVIINKPGTSVKSFNDPNIIGNINISGTGISELYNAVSVEFPHKDLRDQTDYVDLEVPIEDRFPNELDNVLNISMQCINNPIQAQYIGIVELKQSRVDKVIEFRTDYSSFGLKAGDLIDVSSEMYGYVNKVFRITKIVEEDADDGSIQLSITALEYSDDIYDSSGLTYLERNKKTGIIPKSQNTALTENDLAGIASQLRVQPVIATFFNNQIIIAETLSSNWFTPGYLINDAVNRYNTGFSTTIPITGTYRVRYNCNWGGNTFTPEPPDVYGTPESVMKGVQITLKVNGNWNPRPNSFTGDQRVQLLEDHIIEDYVFLNKGDNVEFWISAKCNYGPNHPFANGDPVVSFIKLGGELLLATNVVL